MSKLAKALSASAGNAGGDKLYVEDVFSTFLYTGTASAITVNNGLDLSGEGGLTWLKCRSLAEGHILVDTINGAGTGLISSGMNALFTLTDGLTAFNSNGFTLGASNIINTNNSTNVSWSFRKAPKFFDVVAYTGNATSGRTIAHSLGSTPGMMIVKQTSGVYNWQIYHSGFGATKFLEFNTGATQTSTAIWNDTAPTDSVFTVGNEYGVNRSGYTYLAYLFASDAGGYGDDGTENIIKCGTYVGNAQTPGVVVATGFEPQFVLVKPATTGGPWSLIDNMRGWTADSAGDRWVEADTNGAEFTSAMMDLTATGFTTRANYSSTNSNGQTYIYMAIRRPMKTPESGTEVFAVSQGASGVSEPGIRNSPAFPVDFAILTNPTANGYNRVTSSRLTSARTLNADTATSESSDPPFVFDYMNGFYADALTTDWYGYSWGRATGFMDVVCYTGNFSSSATQAHNLGVVPKLILVKGRSQAYDWQGYSEPTGAGKVLWLDKNYQATDSLVTWNNTSPTASVFTVGQTADVNALNQTFIAYLFATLAGVSKVGSYTGNAGYAVNVDCGFTGGARFILIKRTDSTGDWYTYDSVRGIVSGNDPYFFMNDNVAQVTNTDYIDPLASGFTVTSSAPAGLNASGGTYIFLAIA